MSDRRIRANSEAIAEFEASLGRFAEASRERLTVAETTVRRTVEELEDRRNELYRDISRLQDQIANAEDEDDRSYATRQCEEKEDALAKIRRWQHAVEESVASYEREALRVEELTTATTAKTRTYLRHLLDDLSAYFAPAA